MNNKTPHIVIFIISLIVFSVFINGCSPKKNTFIRRNYHNTTARYNGYFNGKESLKEGVKELAKSHKDDFSRIIPIYALGTEQNAQAITPYMEKAQKKAAIMIHRHSFANHTKGNKEYCKWIDDCYMLSGKADFYKKDYNAAKTTFKGIIRTYPKNEIIYDAMLWTAMCYNQKKDFGESIDYLTKVKKAIKRKKTSNNTIQEYNRVYADYFISQEYYDEAIPYLEKAIKLIKRKKKKKRLAFILAQIYQKNEDYQNALKYYELAIKMNPSYIMAFTAKINMAGCYGSESGSSRLIRKKLNKMLKDEKNKEFSDQIYYALSSIELAEGDTTKGIELLKQSVVTSLSNNNQKAISYLKLADIYFGFKHYENAQAYYDSTESTISKDHPEYDNIMIRASTLTELVENINTIEMEDSMQTLAKMPPNERNKAIERIIQNVKAEELKKKQREAAKKRQLAQMEREKREQQKNKTGNAAKWYFYNSAAMSLGIAEFKKKWGDRQLEDLWRLTNKNIVSFDDPSLDPIESDTSMIKDKKNIITDNTSKEYYLQQIPLTKEAIITSNKKIEDAYYNLGVLYKEKLENYSKSSESFEGLIKRYPDGNHTLKSYYQLYRLYLETNNISKSDYYKNIILQKYPDSQYANIINNPDAYKDQASKNNKEMLLYKEIYLEYTQKQFRNVIIQADTVIKKLQNVDLIRKLDYLKALAYGKVYDKKVFESQLKRIVKTYPTTQVQKEAQIILDYLHGKFDEKKEEKKDTSIYKSTPKEKHFYVLIINDADVNLNTIKNTLSNFNNTHHSSKQYKVKSIIFTKEHQAITISYLSDKEAAIKYFIGIVNNESVSKKLNQSEHHHFVISSSNYKTFYKDKELSLYEEFFKANYKTK